MCSKCGLGLRCSSKALWSRPTYLLLFRCLCNNHMYCPCDAAIARRRKVALEIRLGKIMNPPKHTPVLDCLAPARAVGASSVPASMPQPSANIVDVPAFNFVNVVPAGPVPAAVELHDVPLINAPTIPLNFNVDAPPFIPNAPLSPDITIEVEDWIDSPASSSVPVPVARVKQSKKRRHRPALFL